MHAQAWNARCIHPIPPTRAPYPTPPAASESGLAAPAVCPPAARGGGTIPQRRERLQRIGLVPGRRVGPPFKHKQAQSSLVGGLQPPKTTRRIRTKPTRRLRAKRSQLTPSRQQVAPMIVGGPAKKKKKKTGVTQTNLGEGPFEPQG